MIFFTTKVMVGSMAFIFIIFGLEDTFFFFSLITTSQGQREKKQYIGYQHKNDTDIQLAIIYAYSNALNLQVELSKEHVHATSSPAEPQP